MTKEQYEYLATQIFSSSLEVHKNLGPGLLESVYEFAFLKEMELRNISAQYQVKVPLFYKGFETGKDFFIDILVDSKIITR
jgi:GxxExxY protein